MKDVKILYEDNHVIVAVKPHDIPSQADASGDDDMLTILKSYIKDKYQKPGNVFLGLVHRLDRPTMGVMVFARTSKAAERLSKQFASHEVEKVYTALVEGMPPQQGEFSDYLRKDVAKNVVSVCREGEGKLARLAYEVVSREGGCSRVRIRLFTGRSHQIRVQFASRGFPLLGDAKYGQGGGRLRLCCTRLAFIHPTKKEKMFFEVKEDF